MTGDANRSRDDSAGPAEPSAAGRRVDPFTPGPLASMTAGPELAAALVATDLTTLDDFELIEHSAAVQRQVAWTASLDNDVLVELARRPMRPQLADDDPADVAASWAEPGEQVRQHAADEVAARTRSTARSVQRRINLACSLVNLPATREALRSGSIDLARARVVVEMTDGVQPEVARRLDERWAERAERMTPARLRRGIRRDAVAIDPAAARVREEQARSDRYVGVVPTADGMAELFALLPAVDAQRIRDVLTMAALGERSNSPGDERTLDQLRADLLCEAFRVAADRRELLPGTALGEGCEIQVVVGLSTLLGADDQPGELNGYGPITAQTVRELVPGSVLRRIVTDPLDGEILDVGRTRYRPTAAISRHVKASHPRCTFPGCEQQARRSELDHVVPFPDGPTSAENLRPRCKRHHLLKHVAHVSVLELSDGTTRWQLPTGHEYDNAPEPLLPVPEPPGDKEYGESGREPPDDPPF